MIFNWPRSGLAARIFYNDMDRELKLVLTYKWYDMIESGEKPEEYRDVTPHWVRSIFCRVQGKRISLLSFPKDQPMHQFMTDVMNMARDGELACRRTWVTFYRGYAKDRKKMTYLIEGVSIGPGGKKEWGAIPSKYYIIIKLGEKVCLR